MTQECRYPAGAFPLLASTSFVCLALHDRWHTYTDGFVLAMWMRNPRLHGMSQRASGSPTQFGWVGLFSFPLQGKKVHEPSFPRQQRAVQHMPSHQPPRTRLAIPCQGSTTLHLRNCHSLGWRFWFYCTAASKTPAFGFISSEQAAAAEDVRAQPQQTQADVSPLLEVGCSRLRRKKHEGNLKRRRMFTC